MVTISEHKFGSPRVELRISEAVGLHRVFSTGTDELSEPPRCPRIPASESWESADVYTSKEIVSWVVEGAELPYFEIFTDFVDVPPTERWRNFMNR